MAGMLCGVGSGALGKRKKKKKKKTQKKKCVNTCWAFKKTCTCLTNVGSQI